VERLRSQMYRLADHTSQSIYLFCNTKFADFISSLLLTCRTRCSLVWRKFSRGQHWYTLLRCSLKV